MKLDGFSEVLVSDLDAELFFGSFDVFFDFFSIEGLSEISALLRNIDKVINRISGDGQPVIINTASMVAAVIKDCSVKEVELVIQDLVVSMTNIITS